MPKQDPKPKPLSASRSNPYQHRLLQPANQLMSDISNGLLRTARGEDTIDNDSYNTDSDSGKEVRRRSWTREQKLGAIKYAQSTFIPNHRGITQLILEIRL
jgi:hypothetical protein